jgi:hypothetical protein
MRLSLQRAASRRYDMTGETGSYRYMAPEVFRHEPYNSKVVRHVCLACMFEHMIYLCPLQMPGCASDNLLHAPACAQGSEYEVW